MENKLEKIFFIFKFLNKILFLKLIKNLFDNNYKNIFNIYNTSKILSFKY